MKKLNDYLNQWFGQTNQPHKFLPIWQEELCRNKTEIQQFEAWEKLTIKNLMLDDLHAAHQLNTLSKTSLTFRFISQDLTNGFLFYEEESDYTQQDFIFLFDYLKNQILSLNYKLQHSDKRYFDRKSFAEEIHRYYLKPRLAIDDDNIANQLYGNIHIELYFRNEKVKQLKFLVTAYQDGNYSEAKNYNELLNRLIL